MLREALGRRGLFKRLGVASLLAASGQENIAKLAKVGVGASAALGPFNPPSAPRATAIFRTAGDFASWWKQYGKDSCFNQSRHVGQIDCDIAAFRLPLTTKVRMQRERNYARLKSQSRSDFLSRILRFGEVTVWGDNRPDMSYPTTAGSVGSSLG